MDKLSGCEPENGGFNSPSPDSTHWGVAQLEEPQVLILMVAGSNPVAPFNLGSEA